MLGAKSMDPTSCIKARRPVRKPVIVLFAGTLAAVCFGLVRFGRLRVTRTKPIATSFTLETEAYSYQHNVKGEILSRTVTARRPDGTTVTAETIFPGKPHEHAMRLIRYPDGHSLGLIDAIAAKTTWPANPGQAAFDKQRLLHPPADCVLANYEELIGNDVVLSHKVNVMSVSFQNTAWRAPNLGCEEIQSRQGYNHEGVFKLLSETKAVSLKLGEPDIRLFDPGVRYAELRPSEVLRRETTRVGIRWSEILQQEADREDAMYLAKR